MLAILARALDVTPNELLGFDETPTIAESPASYAAPPSDTDLLVARLDLLPPAERREIMAIFDRILTFRERRRKALNDRLERLRRLLDQLSDEELAQYEAELTAQLAARAAAKSEASVPAPPPKNKKKVA